MTSLTQTTSKGPVPLSADKSLDAHWSGFKQLLAQQLDEIKIVKATFDYSVFAGAKGPLSGADSAFLSH